MEKGRLDGAGRGIARLAKIGNRGILAHLTAASNDKRNLVECANIISLREWHPSLFIAISITVVAESLIVVNTELALPAYEEFHANRPGCFGGNLVNDYFGVSAKV